MIMTIITFDTGKAIHNRIVAQNAVDSAADAAACWQARGCNLLQHLNNLHYEVNRIMYIAEIGALVGCATAPFAYGGEMAAKVLQGTWFAEVYFLAVLAYEGACSVCWAAPLIDWGQEKFAAAVMKTQAVIAKVFPVLAFLYANIMAEQSGGDNLTVVIFQCAKNLLQKVGIDIPGMGSLADFLSGLGGSLPVKIYAFPLDPRTLSLYVEEKKGSGMPWVFDGTYAETLYPPAKTACAADPSVPTAFKATPPEPSKWGWEDSYYWGNPGYMTWIAGKLRKPELLGLGKLRWLATRTEASAAKMEENSKKMFTSDVLSGSPELVIPPFVALASSQVEGTPVVSKGDADAKGQIITVHFGEDTTTPAKPCPICGKYTCHNATPASGSGPASGEKLLIYH